MNPPAKQVDVRDIRDIRNVRDLGWIPGLGRCPGGRHGNSLQFSYLGNPMNTGTWQAAAHGVTKSWTPLKGLSVHTLPIEMYISMEFGESQWITSYCKDNIKV